MCVTKTDIIENKVKLDRKCVKNQSDSVCQNKDRGHMTFPFKDIVLPEFWKLDRYSFSSSLS